MTRDDAFIILNGWRESKTVVSCNASIGGCSIGMRGTVFSVDSEGAEIRNSDVSAAISFRFDFIEILQYSEPKDAVRKFPELAPLLDKIHLSEEQKSAGTISMAFPCTKTFPYLAVVIQEQA